MDFQQNTQPDGVNEQIPAQEPSVMPEQPLQDQPIDTVNQAFQEQPANTPNQAFQEQPMSQNPPMQQQAPYENRNMQAPGNNPYNHNPYGNGTPNPYQNGQSYQNNQPYRNNMPYGNGYPDNNYPNGVNNAYPYYNRSSYQLPYAEPGSSLANAAMILGIISIIASFTFTVYPAFILGSIAIVLALLSKGSRTSFFQKARTGIICGTIGLITNTIVVIFSLIFVFTNPDARETFDQMFEQQYGMTFEEMMEEIEGGTFSE